MAILKCALIAFFCLSFTHARNPPTARNLKESREHVSPIPREFDEAKSANNVKSDEADETQDRKVGPSSGLGVDSRYGSMSETGDGIGIGFGIGRGGPEYCGYQGCRPYEDCMPYHVGDCNPIYDPYCWPYKGAPYVSGEHQDDPAMSIELTDPPAKQKRPDREGQVGSQN